MRLIYYHFISVDSTNSWAKRQLEDFSFDDFAIITADTQTDGRGRESKNWHSPPKQNLYLTYAFFVEDSCDLFFLSQLASLSIYETLIQCKVIPKIKWPNDILIGDMKVGGILVEVQRNGDKVFVCLGIGLNINMTNEELTKTSQSATSLFVETGEKFAIDEVESMITKAFLSKLNDKESYHKFQERWLSEVSWLVNTERTFSDQGKSWKGKIRSIEKDGTLILEGSLKRISTGTILQEI